MFCFKPSITTGILLLIILLVPISVSGQSDISNFEVGIQASYMGDRPGILFFEPRSLGGGVRLTYNLNRFLAVEGEMNYFPETGLDKVRKIQGQFGVKSGMRFNKFGLFGKIRPGFMHTEYEYQFFCIQTDSLCPLTFRGDDTGFSFDVGGVFEFYPAKRVIMRFDIGDTIVTREDQFPYRGNRSFPFFLPQSRHTSNTLQLSTGIGIRF
jgi:hypothetical protein